MTFSPDSILDKLSGLNIAVDQHKHPVVMTVEEQVAHLPGVQGVILKNLFLKDKKDRFYLVTALHDTKIELKVLSSRLGLGKNVVRFAESDHVTKILQVPLGSATPLAVAQPAAADVVLLLDKKIKTEEKILMHPLSNESTIVMSPADLEKFLQSCGREAFYVDLEAVPGEGTLPALSRSNPGDLAVVADAAKTPAAYVKGSSGAAESGSGRGGPAQEGPSGQSKDSKQQAGKGGKGKEGKESSKGGASSSTRPKTTLEFAKEIMEMVLSVEAGDRGGQEELLKNLEGELMMFKTIAYAQGSRDERQRIKDYLSQ